MLSALRHDLYILRKSRIMWICYAIAAICFLIRPLETAITGPRLTVMSTITEMVPTFNTLVYGILIFAILFFTRDISSGYIKNIYKSSNKVCYVLSKYLLYVVLTTLYLMSYLLVMLIICRAYRVPYHIYKPGYDEFTVGEFWILIAMGIGVYWAYGAMVLLFAMVCRFMFVVAIGTLAYHELSGYLYSGINAAVYAITKKTFKIEPYTILGLTDEANNIAFNIGHHPQNGYIAMASILIVIALALFFSWLAYKRKNF